MARRPSPSLSQAIQAYQEDLQRRRKAANTLRRTRLVLTQFLRSVGDIKVGSLTSQHLYNHVFGIGGLRDSNRGMTADGSRPLKPLSDATLVGHLSVLRGFVAYLYDMRWNTSPLLEMLNREGNQVKPEIRVMLQPSAQQMLDMVLTEPEPRNRFWLAAATQTGLRSIEMRNWTVGDLHLDESYAHTFLSKGRKWKDITMSPSLVEETRRWLKAYALNIGRPLRPEDAAVPAMRTRHWDWVTNEAGEKVRVNKPPKYVVKKKLEITEPIVKAALERVGLPTYQQGTHTLRRGAARAYFEHLVDSGTAPVRAMRWTQDFLNHSSINTTERYLGMTVEQYESGLHRANTDFLAIPVQAEQDSTVVEFRQRAGSLGE